jgi:hypothetical protein
MCMKRLVVLFLVVAGLLAAMAATHRLATPPAVRAQNADGQFDAVRAKARLTRVLGNEAPHPADTAASDGVRGRLVGELRRLGLQPRVDDRFACNALMKGRGTACARVRNVVVTVGPAAGKHLLINSHYDSVPVGPGAADAGVGVATMLEVAALLKDRPLARPVTFLFNEGEELGLVGARAFLDGDPLAARVDSLINLEARGVRGPVNMFETSVPNVAPIRLFDRAVERPVANSLAVSAYRQLPNYTDVNSFEERGWLTLNLAPVGNETRYHSAGDNLQALDGATLQHMGDQTLQLASALASGPAPQQVAGETLFMNFLTVGLITAPMWLGVLLLAGLLLVFAAVTWRRKALLTGVPLLVAALLLGTGAAWLGLTVVGGLRSGMFWRAHPGWTELAVYAGVVAAALAVLATAARRLEVRQLRAAFWLLFLGLGALFTFVAPGALIYFVLPPLIVALGMLAARWWRPVETVAAVLAALLLFLTLGAMLGLLEELLNGGPLWVFAPLGALMLLPWLIESKPLADGAPRPALLAGAAALLIGGWAVSAAMPAYSADRQQQWTLQYVADPQARQPVWSVVNDRAPLPAAFDRFGQWRQMQLPSLGTRLRWVAPALPQPGLVPARALPASVMSIPGGRRVRVRLQSNGADSVTLVTDGARVVAAGAPGQLRRFDPQANDTTATLSCTGRSCDGAVLELQIRGEEPLNLTVLGTRWSLPASAAPLIAARPAHTRAQYLPDATILVSRLQV